MFKLRPMREDELPMVKQWAVDEGWNPGNQDLEFCFAAYPKAFYILENNEGTPVGCTTIMRYSENYAFLGLLIVIPSERKKGGGRFIWDETMSMLQYCNTIRFYGVLPRVEFYKPFSFSPIAYHAAYMMKEPEISKKLSASSSVVRQNFFQPPKDEDVAAMAAYEEEFLKIRRDRLIAAFIQKNDGNVLLSTDKDGKVTGYCAIRPCEEQNTYTIKPLYADTYDIAKEMFLELLRHISSLSPETLVTLEIPLDNPHIERLVDDFGLKPYAELDTAVMNRSQIDQLLEDSYKDKVYALFSFEFS